MTTRTRRPARLAPLAGLALALSVAACGGGGSAGPDQTTAAPVVTDGPADTAASSDGTTPEPTSDGTVASALPSTTSGEDVERIASDIGVTPDTITIGLVVADVSTLPDLPIRMQLDTTEYGSIERFIDDINSRGGIHGRQIELETFTWNPLDIPASLDAACLAAGEDAELLAAVTPLFVGEAAVCLTGDKGVPTVFASTLPDDLVDRSNGNALVLEGTALTLANDALDILVEQGRITDLGEVGIVTSDAPGLAQVVEGVTATIEALGGTVRTYEITPTPLGADPTHAVAAQNMKRDGIEYVYPVITAPNTASVMTEADLIGYTPTWILTDHAERTSVITVNNAPVTQLEHAIGVSAQILGYSDDVPLSPAAQECIDFRNALPGATPIEEGSPTFLYANDTCQLALTLDALLDAAGPNPTRASFVAAASAVSPFHNRAGATLSWGPGKLSAPDEYRIVEYSPDCTGMENGCFLPTSDWIAAPR